MIVEESRPATVGALLPAPWGARQALRATATGLALYLLLSLLAGMLLRGRGVENAFLLGAVGAGAQLALLLPPLLVMLRGGQLRARLGLDLLQPRMVLEWFGALLAAYAGIFLWGLVLLPFGQRAQEPLLPLFGDDLSALGALLLLGVGVAPALEEIVFRGFLLGGLRERLSARRASLLSGAIFAAAHLQPLAFPALLWLGFVLGELYQRSRSLWPAIALHVTINGLAVLGQWFLLQQGLL